MCRNLAQIWHTLRCTSKPTIRKLFQHTTYNLAFQMLRGRTPFLKKVLPPESIIEGAPSDAYHAQTRP